MYKSDLFSDSESEETQVYPYVYRFTSFVSTKTLLNQLSPIIEQSPFRKMMTPNGHYTNIAFSNCGDYGWISDAKGYSYSDSDPLSNRPWQPMPKVFKQVAQDAAAKAGYKAFEPDTCLINQYLIGSKLGSHQDKNERDFKHPIVSVSIGLTAVFQVFGDSRSGIKAQFPLYDGDVMVWGKSARLMYHGIKTLTADPLNPQLKQRINLTFRKSH